MATGTPTKQCRKCGVEKPASEFYASKNRDGLSSYCRPCAKAGAAIKRKQYRAEGRYRERDRVTRAARFKRLWADPAFRAKENERKRKWADKYPERARAYFLNRKHRALYNMTTAEIRAMIKRQGNECASCHRTFGVEQNDAPHVDHNHSTNRVRQILCGGCNKAAGMLGDNWQRAELLAAYLKRHSEEEMV